VAVPVFESRDLRQCVRLRVTALDGARFPALYYCSTCADAFYQDSLVFPRTSRIKHAASDIVATWSGMSDLRTKVREHTPRLRDAVPCDEFIVAF
jgi:hypothetical protein